MPNLTHRSYQAELIDDLNLSNEALAQNLRELAFINKWLGGNQLTINGLNELLKQKNIAISDNIHIWDIGCGGGDMLQLMSNWAKKKGLNASFVGLDANPFMIDYSKKNLGEQQNLRFIVGDAFAENQYKNEKIDIASLTLFCHHFTEDQLVLLFSVLAKSCKIGFVVNDLHRHPIAYHSISWLTAIFSKSYLVKNDARLSVWRGFKRAELEEILRKANIVKYTIKWRWAWRWEVIVDGH